MGGNQPSGGGTVGVFAYGCGWVQPARGEPGGGGSTNTRDLNSQRATGANLGCVWRGMCAIQLPSCSAVVSHPFTSITCVPGQGHTYPCFCCQPSHTTHLPLLCLEGCACHTSTVLERSRHTHPPLLVPYHPPTHPFNPLHHPPTHPSNTLHPPTHHTTQPPTQALERIAEDLKGLSIDVVLYVDRLDLYRVEPLDKRVSEAAAAAAVDRHAGCFLNFGGGERWQSAACVVGGAPACAGLPVLVCFAAPPPLIFQ